MGTSRRGEGEKRSDKSWEKRGEEKDGRREGGNRGSKGSRSKLKVGGPQ